MTIAPQLVSAGASVLGGILSGQAAKKAAKIQAGAQQSARQAQEKAYAQIKQMQDPYIQAGYTGLEALTGRLGLPTEAVSGAVGKTAPQGAFDAKAYLEANPDVQAQFGQLSPDNMRNNLGIDPSPEAFAQWHYGQYGQFEGRSPGGAAPVATAASTAQTQTPATPTPTTSLTPASIGAAQTGNPGTYGASDVNYQAPAPYQTQAFDYGLDDYTGSPGYQWQQDEAQRAILANASATGARQSGATLKALQDRAQQIAYQNFVNERAFARGAYESDRGFDYGRYIDQRNFDRSRYVDDRNYLTNRYDAGVDDLMRYTDMGRQAAGVLGAAALGTGSDIGQTYIGAGNAYAGAAKAQGDVWSGVANDLGGVASGLMGSAAGGGAQNSTSTLGNLDLSNAKLPSQARINAADFNIQFPW